MNSSCTASYIQIINKGSDKIVKGNDYYIISYDMVGKFLNELKSLKAKLAAEDEFTMIANPKTARTKAVVSLIKSIAENIPASGTPIRKRTKEFYPTLNIVRSDMFPNFFKFAKRYCAAHKITIRNGKSFWNMDGFSNGEELNDRLSTVMIRRMKSGALPGLPAKLRTPLILEMPDKYKKMYDKAEKGFMDVVDDLKGAGYLEQLKARKVKSDYDKYRIECEEYKWPIVPFESYAFKQAFSALGNQDRMIVISRMNYMRQIVGMVKAEAMPEILEEALDGDNKFALFIHHRDVAAYLIKEFEKNHKVLTILGGSTDAHVEKVEITFREDEEAKLLILSTLAAGQGFNFTSASNGYMVERQWVPSDETQIEDRLSRIGQVNEVLIRYLVIEDCLFDKKMNDVVQSRMKGITISIDEKSVIKEVLESMLIEGK